MKNALFISDSRIDFLGTLLEQIKIMSPDTFDEAIIYYEDITKEQKDVLNSIMPCRFVEYNSPLPKELFNLSNFKKFTSFSFARYEMFKYLDEFDRVMWLDTDVLIQNNLDELIKQADKTGIAIISEAIDDNSNDRHDICRTNFNKPIFEYNMNADLYCSALIVISRALKEYNKLTDWCYEKTQKYAQELVLPDQGVLNLLVQEFNLNVQAISSKKYGCYPKNGKDCTNATIIHAWGSRKFWNNWYLRLKYPQWFEFYKNWCKKVSIEPKEINPPISVVIPAYKPDLSYFKEALKSLLEQKYNGIEFDNFEIIIVSEPFNQEEIKEFIDSFDDPRIKLIFNEKRLGIAASINRGIKEAKGKYIARFDDDDISLPKRLFKQFEFMQKNPDCDLCTVDYEYFQDMKGFRKAYGGEFAHALSLLTCPFDHPCVMFKKDFFVKNNLFYDETRQFCEDWELWTRAFDCGLKVGAINDEILLRHRWRKGSACRDAESINQMNEISKIQFRKLGIELKNHEAALVRIYTGKVPKDSLKRLKEIFSLALKNNAKIKMYSQKELKKLFDIRLREAEKKFLRLNENEQMQLKFSQKFFSIKNYQNKKVITILGLKLKLASTKLALNNEIIELQKQIADIKEDTIRICEEKINTSSDKLLKLIPYKDRKIFLFGTATHDNIGDLAISEAQRLFAQKFFPEYELLEFPTYEFDNYVEYIKKIISPDDIIWFAGGGNLGNRWINEEFLRRKVLNTFSKNTAFIFPQSIYFTKDKMGETQIELSRAAYEKSKNLTIIARDPKSLEYAKEYFPNAKSELFPDIVCFYPFNYTFERQGVLSCIRDLGDESGLTQEQYNKVMEIINNLGLKVDYTLNRYSKDFIPVHLRNFVVNEQLKNFASHKVVVTDRLHGLIFSIVTHTPCVVLKSEDHKIKEFMHFLKDSNAVAFINNNVDEIKNAVNNMLNIQTPTYPNWEEYFNNMAEFIKRNEEING